MEKAHYCSVSPVTGRNSGERLITKKTIFQIQNVKQIVSHLPNNCFSVTVAHVRMCTEKVEIKKGLKFKNINFNYFPNSNLYLVFSTSTYWS